MNSPHSTVCLGNTIVLVDDEPVLLMLMEELVDYLGFTSKAFSRADEALPFILSRRDEVALLLSDFSTPGSMTGGDLASAVLHPFPDLPVVVTSGFLDASAQLDPSVTFVPKPWGVDEMAKVVHELTHRVHQ